jgi:hypothetical protein
MKAKNAGNRRKARSTEEGENSPAPIAPADNGRAKTSSGSANGSSRSGLDRIRLSPYRPKVHEPPMRSALILPKTANQDSLSAFPAIPAVSAL